MAGAVGNVYVVESAECFTGLARAKTTTVVEALRALRGATGRISRKAESFGTEGREYHTHVNSKTEEGYKKNQQCHLLPSPSR